MRLRKIICTAFILIAFTVLPLHAQLKLYSIPKSSKNGSLPSTAAHQSKSTARIQDDQPLPLPFWDDFSTYSLDSSNLPTVNRALWTNSESVWLNSGMGINEPSINVVTFDGLDSTNLPYKPTQIFVSGFSDELTSKPINLKVDVSHKDSIYLSFFYQWMGNGEAPDKNDFLALEFRDSTNKWNEVQRMTLGDNPDRTVFIYSIVKVDAPYLYKAFQFRFRNYGRESGPFDTWNLDYVYLDKNRTAKDISFPDRAIASGASTLFDAYYSMPLNHFFDKKLLNDIKFDVKNLKKQIDSLERINVNFITTTKFKKYYNASTASPFQVIGDSTAIRENGGLIGPLERVHVEAKNNLNPNDKSEFDSDASRIDIELKIKIRSGDTKDPLKKRFNLHAPVDFTVNDSTTSFYTLKDYYAYDDGVAEYSVGLTQPGNFAACEFNTLTTNPDTLTGFDVYFPDFAIPNTLSTRFYIYGDKNGMPNDSSILRQTSVSIQKNGLNTFKRFSITPTIVPLKFYIGWVETSANPVKIGLDRNNDTGDKIFVKVNNQWGRNNIVHGSLMIRAVFGKSGIITALPEKKPPFALYPNPTSGTFFVQGHYEPVKIINTTGQSVPYTVEEFGDEKRITLQTSPGLYLIQLQKGSSVEVRKIIVK